jgi:uncharacterized Fe-S cluster protein YjdI/CDGSH-type Zn-finger protein
MTKRRYETSQIRVHWDSSLCIHTAICLRSLPEVFDVNRRPWVDIEGAAADEIAEAIERCPSGALTYERLDGAPDESAPTAATVVPWPNGPLLVRGSVEIRDVDGDVFTAGPRFALCRCGHSRNQPFCDLTHRETGFRNVPRVSDRQREDAENPAQITPVEGP